MKQLFTNLKIKATKGSRTIAKADSLFDYIDPEFVNYGVDKESIDTKETEIQELTQNVAVLYLNMM